MSDSLEQAAKNSSEIAEIKRKYNSGEISRDEAKRLAQPILDRINSAAAVKTRELNEKYGTNRRPHRIDFVSIMRDSYQ